MLNYKCESICRSIKVSVEITNFMKSCITRRKKNREKNKTDTAYQLAAPFLDKFQRSHQNRKSQFRPLLNGPCS